MKKWHRWTVEGDVSAAVAHLDRCGMEILAICYGLKLIVWRIPKE